MISSRVCQDENAFRILKESSLMKKWSLAYASGRRSTVILDGLAKCKVLADNTGEKVLIPQGFDRSTWDDVLSHLVAERLGNLRCLKCWEYWTDSGYRCFIVDDGIDIRAPLCPHCGGTLSEDVVCTIGISK